MKLPDPIFSTEYENNYAWMQCMTNWNNYKNQLAEWVFQGKPESKSRNGLVFIEWRNEIMKDMYNYAVEWLDNNRHPQKWLGDKNLE